MCCHFLWYWRTFTSILIHPSIVKKLWPACKRKPCLQLDQTINSQLSHCTPETSNELSQITSESSVSHRKLWGGWNIGNRSNTCLFTGNGPTFPQEKMHARGGMHHRCVHELTWMNVSEVSRNLQIVHIANVLILTKTFGKLDFYIFEDAQFWFILFSSLL